MAVSEISQKVAGLVGGRSGLVMPLDLERGRDRALLTTVTTESL
jgi:hypothetical protein